MFYVLWDVEAGNIVGDFATVNEALSIVRELLDDNAPDYADALSLGRTANNGATRLVAEGQGLASKVRGDPDTSHHVIYLGIGSPPSPGPS